MVEWTLVENDRLNPGIIHHTYIKFVGQDSFTYHVISFVKYLTLLRFNLFKISINKLLNSVSLNRLKKNSYFNEQKHRKTNIKSD